MKKIFTALLLFTVLATTAHRATGQYRTGDYNVKIEVVRVCGHGNNEGNEEYRWRFSAALDSSPPRGAGTVAGDGLRPGTCLDEGHISPHGGESLPFTLFEGTFNIDAGPHTVQIGMEGYEKDCRSSCLNCNGDALDYKSRCFCPPLGTRCRDDDDDDYEQGGLSIPIDALRHPGISYAETAPGSFNGKYGFKVRYTVTPPVMAAPVLMDSDNNPVIFETFCSGEGYRLAAPPGPAGAARYLWYENDFPETVLIGHRDSTDQQCADRVRREFFDCRGDCMSQQDPVDRELCLSGCREEHDIAMETCRVRVPIITPRWTLISDTTAPVSPLISAEAITSGRVQKRYSAVIVTDDGVKAIGHGASGRIIDIFPRAPKIEGLPDSTDTELTEGESPVFDANEFISIQHVTCKGEPTGKITIKKRPGPRDYFYLLQHDTKGGIGAEAGEGAGYPIVFPDVDPEFTGGGLPAGTYTLLVENRVLDQGSYRGLCYEPHTIVIQEPAALPSGTASALEYKGGFNVSCHAGQDGTIDISPSGGTGPYTFTLKGSDGFSKTQGETRFTGLKAKDGQGKAIAYSFQIRDAHGCLYSSSAAQQLTLTVPNELKVDGTTALNSYAAPGAPGKAFDISCHGGTDSLAFTLSGGVKPYTLSINGQVKARSVGDSEVAILPGLKGGTGHNVTASDANGCQITAVARLSQPGPISLPEGKTSPPGCHGAATASLELKATGGLPLSGHEYTYRIEHTDIPDDFDATIRGTSASFTGLIGGDYRVTVTDNYGCEHQETITMAQPPKPDVNIVTNPISCFGEKDGEATATINGGTPPYDVTWRSADRSILKKMSNIHSGSIKVDGLGGGTHYLSYVDTKGCPFEKGFSIEEPDGLFPGLGGGTTICEGSSLTLDAGFPTASHQWSSDKGFSSSDQVVTVSEEGTYTITIMDSEGCSGTETFELSIYDERPEADFLMPSKAAVGDTVVLVNITWPSSQEFRWELPDSITAVPPSAYHQQLIFPSEGTYTITLYTGKGQCLTEFAKQIVVLGAGDVITDDVFGQVNGKNILKFSVSPNPNEGKFTAHVILRKPMRMRMRMVDINGKTDIRELAATDSKEHAIGFEPGPGQKGVHFLILEVGDEIRVLRILIQ